MRSHFILALAGLAAANPLVAFAPRAEGVCNRDNCLRAIIADSKPTIHGEADCASYFATTVTPATSTVTETVSLLFTGSATSDVTITTTVPETQTVVVVGTQTSTHTTTTTLPQQVMKRQATSFPSIIPSYASACSGLARYSSACSCVGVTPTTITADTPMTTTTVTVSVTPTTSTQTNTATESVTLTSTTLTTSTTTTVAEATQTACYPCAPILKNPSFQSGLQGWTVPYGAQYTESPAPLRSDGTAALGFNLPTNGAAGIEQRLNTVTGNTYSGTVDVFFDRESDNCYLNAFLNGQWFWSFSTRYGIPLGLGRR